MMNVGLVGSKSFYNTYTKALEKYEVVTSGGCSIIEAMNQCATFENLTLQCEYIFFESIDSNSFHLITAGLKNGKNIVVEKTSLSLTQLNEMYHTSVEGNLNCILLNSSQYYKFFEALQLKIKNPVYIEMDLEYECNEMYYLSDNINDTLYNCMQNMLSILKSEIKQINVKSSKIFSNRTDFISIQLDFSDGCSANIKMIEKNSRPIQTIQIYQPSKIFSMNLIEESICTTADLDGNLATTNEDVSGIDVTEKKIKHFLGIEKISKMEVSSILEKYLAMEQSEKIIKKINSLYE